MNHPETIQEFYQRVYPAQATVFPTYHAGAGHFNVFERNACYKKTPYSRRDYYKVSLIIGTGKLHYADKWILIDRPALLFSNPIIPYSWEAQSDEQHGWFALFTENFVHPNERKVFLQDSPLFQIGAAPVFFIEDHQLDDLSRIFRKMTEEIASEYVHKYDVLRNYLHLIIHEAMKMQPAETFERQINASTRITSLFMELLERQFPIDTPENGLKLKTANDFAKSLSIHANHLNRSVKEITGKTTTEHISARIVKEANALLSHTSWNISEIAYALGFEYPAYFNIFFKKQTGQTPGGMRSRV